MADRLVGLPDQDIVSRLRKGDYDLLTQLFRAYWEPLCKFAYLYVHDNDSAQEIVADIFARLWEKRKSWSVRSSVETYLFGAVRNEARMLHRQTTRRSEITEEHLPEDMGLSTQLIHPDVLTELSDQREIIRQAIELLPERLREVLMLRIYQGLGYDEIATVTGTSKAAVQQSFSRAARALKDKLPHLLD